MAKCGDDSNNLLLRKVQINVNISIERVFRMNSTPYFYHWKVLKVTGSESLTSFSWEKIIREKRRLMLLCVIACFVFCYVLFRFEYVIMYDSHRDIYRHSSRENKKKNGKSSNCTTSLKSIKLHNSLAIHRYTFHWTAIRYNIRLSSWLISLNRFQRAACVLQI